MNHKTISVTGISIGGGNIQVTELNGLPSLLNMNTPTIIIVHRDIPGMIALSHRGPFSLWYQYRPDECYSGKSWRKAIMIIEVDSRIAKRAIEEIRKIPHLHNVNFFK